MSKKIRCIDLKTSEGKVILRLALYEREIEEEESVEPEGKQKERKKRNPEESEKKDVHQMTDAQKRHLFRLLAGRGIENDKAHEQLKSLFQVDSLKEVTKLEASKMIEQMLEEEKGGENNRPPF